MTLLFPLTVGILLDLSAAFDTVDQFFPALKAIARFGIFDHALNWFCSYLSDRTQFVSIQDVFSLMNDLSYGPFAILIVHIRYWVTFFMSERGYFIITC